MFEFFMTIVSTGIYPNILFHFLSDNSDKYLWAREKFNLFSATLKLWVTLKLLS